MLDIQTMVPVLEFKEILFISNLETGSCREVKTPFPFSLCGQNTPE